MKTKKYSTQPIKTPRLKPILWALFILLALPTQATELWRGLVVAPEQRCSPYNRKSDYRYSQSLEDRIIQSMAGRIYGPYTGRYFENKRMTDIEHMVATSEAHDSGLCAAGRERRMEFANDLLNLTLAAPAVNRCGLGGKCAKDAGEWMPDKNKCWFAGRIVQVKRKYRLSVDRREAHALEAILSRCRSIEMVF